MVKQKEKLLKRVERKTERPEVHPASAYIEAGGVTAPAGENIGAPE